LENQVERKLLLQGFSLLLKESVLKILFFFRLRINNATDPLRIRCAILNHIFMAEDAVALGDFPNDAGGSRGSGR
jgi:hypothetical protein